MVDSVLMQSKIDKCLELLSPFQPIFDHTLTTFGNTSAVVHRINTSNSAPVKSRPYRAFSVELRTIQDQLFYMLPKGVALQSSSRRSSPVVLVQVKDGFWRFRINYRRQYNVTKKDVYPLPRIENALDTLEGSKFLNIDLRSGDWQPAVDENEREKTGFVTPDTIEEFRLMTFGLCNARGTVEQTTYSLLRGFK